MSSTAIDRIEKRIGTYHKDAEGWQVNHDDAAICLDLELLLQEGLATCDALNHLDEKQRAMVLVGDLAYDPEMEKQIRRIYEIWLQSSELILNLKAVELLEDKGFQVRYADEFRSACREVRGILSDDEEFFADDKLVELRDKAIDSHRRGECSPLGD